MKVKKEDTDFVPWLRCPSSEYQKIHELSKITKALDKYLLNLGYYTNIYKIQKYDNNTIGINPHSDKILDLDFNTPIFIARFGSTRIVVLTNKLTKEKIEVPMTDNSLLIISYKTNTLWTNAIKKDNEFKDVSFSIVARNSVITTKNYIDIIYNKEIKI